MFRFDIRPSERYEPRASGRTMKMILSLPKEEEFDGQIYVVAINHVSGKELKHRIADLRGLEYSKRVNIVSSIDFRNQIRGVDPLKLYFDHAALEYGKLQDVKDMYNIIDEQARLLGY